MKNNKIEQERWDMAKIMADNFHINGEGWDDSDFEWTAHCLQEEGYHKQNEWISVKKRMPEKGQPILVYRPEGDMKFKAMPYTDYYWERWNTDWERWNTDKERKNLITHWMPLPEAPKKGGEK